MKKDALSLVESSRRIQLVAGFIVAILALGLTLSGAPPSPLAGTWKLNIAQSRYDAGPPQYKKSTCRIEFLADGLRIVYDMVGTRGGMTHLEWTGRLDGQDYPIQGIDEVLTNAYTRVDDRTYDIVVKVDGSRVATARIAIAADGKTLTTVTTSRNALGKTVLSTVVYERQ
jgi:hypothetical protein